MPAFSYAQAAKGLAPSASQPSIKDTKDVKEESLDQMPTSKVTTKSDLQPQSNTKSPSSGPRSEEKDTRRPGKDNSMDTPNHDEAQDKENVPPSRRPHKPSVSSHDTPKVIEESSATKENHIPSPSAEPWDTAVGNEKESVSSDKDKSRDTEDDWEKISIPSVAAEKELKAAPIPTVNVWQQRMDAKKREQAQKPPAGGPPTGKSTADDSKRKSAHERDAPNVSKAPAKIVDRAEFSSSQSSRPASRGEKREGGSGLGDGASWPTPEFASVEERKKSVQADRAEKADARPGPKSTTKNWVQMPFVPTAKFETQLPPSAAKRGGRNSRGGRDGSGRGGHFSGNGDRNDQTGTMGPPPPRHGGDQDRGRKTDANRGGRASSLPAGNQRAQSHEASLATSRKPSAPAAKESIPAQAPAAAPFVPAADSAGPINPESRQDSRSSSQQNAPSGSSVKANESNAGQMLESTTDVSVQQQTTDSNARQPFTADRGKSHHNSNYRSNEYSRGDRGGARGNREWSRGEKTDNAHEKVRSWREHTHSGEVTSHRERGSDRGRGSYRGRGSHTYGPTYSGPHPYTAPLPQNGFEVSKSGSGDTGRRQSSQPYSGPNQSTPGRNPSRSTSIPMPTMYPGQGFYPTVPGMNQGLPPLQTDMQGYGVPQSMSMQPGIMTAMPYSDELSSYAMMSMVATQLEYYFSIDNLCKDLYLRKNMDSQGWVLLNVVAGFKRIKQLVGSDQTIDTLRMVIGQVKNIEYIRGEDGEDRIRRKGTWKDFVLPMGDRLSHAQNDGPTIQPEYHYQELPQASGEAMPFVPGQMRSPQGPAGMPPMNGMYNGPASPPMYGPIPPFDGPAGDQRHSSYGQQFDDSRRESAASPFSPSSGQRVLSGAIPNGAPVPGINGHGRSLSRSFVEEKFFPDEDIQNIQIYKRERTETDTGMPPVERALSNESQNSQRNGLNGRKPSEQYVGYRPTPHDITNLLIGSLLA